LGLKSSKIIKSGYEEIIEGRGVGRKKGTVGIQGEFQIEREEKQWIL
jgi:hypothetical protein